MYFATDSREKECLLCEISSGIEANGAWLDSMRA